MSIQTIRVVIVGTMQQSGGNASLTLRSSGDSNDPDTHPYTFENSGIIVKDVNNAEVFRLWATDPVADFSLYIGAGAGANIIEYSAGSQATVAIGYHSLHSGTTANDNVAVGAFTGGSSLVTGDSNVFVGMQAQAGSDISSSIAIGFSSQVSGNRCIAIGRGAVAGEGGTAHNTIVIGYQASAPGENRLAIGSGAFAGSDNTAVIGNADVTDIYFGSTSGSAILHGKGDAIVFPDSNPHIVGAGYWSGGVLTRSNG